jgi:hypothetical protein
VTEVNDKGNDFAGPVLPDVTTVTVKKKAVVDGTPVKQRRRRGTGTRTPRAIKHTIDLSDCDPRVAAAAQEVRKPGQKLRVVSTQEVWVVNK